MKLKIEGFPSFLDIMALVFIHYKVTGAVDWSWWLVLLPMYGSVVVLFTLAVIKAVRRRFWPSEDERSRLEALEMLMKQAREARLMGLKTEGEN